MINFFISLYIYFNLNTICVQIKYSPDVFLENKVMIIPVQDDLQYGYSLNMWYDYSKDTLYRKPCLQCIYVGIVQVDCNTGY